MRGAASPASGARTMPNVPALSGFDGLAVLKGGIVAAAPRAAMAPWPVRLSTAPQAVTVAISCAGVAGGDGGGPDLPCLPVDPDVEPAPDAWSRHACAGSVRREKRSSGLCPEPPDPSPPILMPVRSTGRCSRPLAPRPRVDVRHVPVRACQRQEAPDDAGRLSQRPADRRGDPVLWPPPVPSGRVVQASLAFMIPGGATVATRRLMAGTSRPDRACCRRARQGDRG